MPDNPVEFSVNYALTAAGESGIAYVAAVPEEDRKYRRQTGIGRSWADASTNLQDTINRYYKNGIDASGGTNYDAIWVLKGTYTPESWAEGIASDGQKIAPDGSKYGIRAADRLDNEGKDKKENKAFVLRPGLKIYGGFEGTEDSYNPETDKHDRTKTILSGGYNSCHVVLAVNIPADSGTMLHSLTIANGQASSVISPNPAYITTGGAVIYQRSGAGVYNHNASPEFKNVNIEDNRAGTYGGELKYTYINDTAAYGAGVYNISLSGGACSPTFTDVLIRRNTVVGHGGGMANLRYYVDGVTGGITSDAGTPVLERVTIENNSSSGGHGGGIFNFANDSPVICSPQITNSLIQQNSASTGGGVSNYSNARPFFSRVRITNNAAANGGGVYEGSCRSRYTDVTIEKNTGFSTGGGIATSGSTTTMTYVTIDNNRSGGGGWGPGGGIYTVDSRLIMTNALITNNTADEAGGGIHLRGDSHDPNAAGILILTNGKITGNQGVNENQGGNGGGLITYFMSEKTETHSGYVCAVFTNVLIAGNTATVMGGGIANRFGGAYGLVMGRFTNVTVAGNKHDGTGTSYGGGGVSTYSSKPDVPGSSEAGNLAPHYDVKFTNSVIWGNTDNRTETGTDNIRDPFNVGGFTGRITYIKSLVEGKEAADLYLSGFSASRSSDNLDSGGYTFTFNATTPPYLEEMPLDLGDTDKYPKYPDTNPSSPAYLLKGLDGTWTTTVTELLTHNLVDAAAADAGDTNYAIDHFLKSDVRSAVGARYDWNNAVLATDLASNYTDNVRKNGTIDLGAYEQ
jgi:hypothetical protein